jgi:hypothetical protein
MLTDIAAATEARLQAQVQELQQIEVTLRNELQVTVTALTAAQALLQQQQQQVCMHTLLTCISLCVFGYNAHCMHD